MRGSKVLVLGVAYKAGVGDIRESPALKIMGRLQELGADLAYHDPYVPELSRLGLASTELDAGLADADLVIIVTAHPEVDHAGIAASHRTLDLRGVTRHVVPSGPARALDRDPA